jgi:alkylation response protein AidB-like acyl-CoA dehydrogenase
LLTLSEEQQVLRDSLEDVFDPQAAIAEFRNKSSFEDRWPQAVELGLAGLFASEELGGNGFGIAGATIVAEAIGRSLAQLPFVGSGVLGPLLLRNSTHSAAAGWLGFLSEGKARFALAIDEGIHHDPNVIQSRYAGGKLTAAKHFVLDGGTADLIGVVARDETGNRVVALIESSVASGAITPYRLIDRSTAARLNVEAVPATLIATGTELSTALDTARTVLAAELLGIAAEVERRTIDYLRTRVQFGRSIGSFQALQHRMAHLHTEVEMTRSAVFGAAEALTEQRDDATAAALLAKCKASGVARVATAEALQLHGGIGMTEEFDLGYYIKRAAVVAEALGSEAWCADELSRTWQLSQ